MFDYINSQSRYIYIVQLNIQYEVLLQLQLRSSLERAKIHSVASLQYIKRCLAVAYRAQGTLRVRYSVASQGGQEGHIKDSHGSVVQYMQCGVVVEQLYIVQDTVALAAPACTGCPPPNLAYLVLAQPPPPLYTARTPTASLLRTKTVILTRNTQRILLRRPTPIDRKYADETTMYSNKTQFQFQDPFLGIRRSFFDLVGVG